MQNNWTVISGTNRGIGLQLAEQLSARGESVLALCRQASDDLRHTGATVIEGIDVSDANTFPLVRAALQGKKIACLIHNAGMMSGGDINESADSIAQQLMVNAVAPFALTQALLAEFAMPAKLAIITSRMGSMTDNDGGGFYGYRMSKAAVNAAGVSLATDLKSRAIAVALLHPGYVRTGMTGGRGHLEPAQSARLLIERLDALTLDSSGSFWHCDGTLLPF